MPVEDFIEARILVDGGPLTEYPVPHDEITDPDTSTCYVEAVTGQKFTVSVTILPGFQLRGAGWLFFNVYIDDSKDSWTKATSSENLPQSEDTVLAGRSIELSGFVAKDEDGDWREHSLSFGALDLTEREPAEDEFSLEEVQKIGSIEVRFFRADRITRETPYLSNRLVPMIQDEIPEKLVKRSPIKNNVVYYASNARAAAPQPILYNYKPLKGAAGKEIVFRFKYRDRNILQQLGCIPRSPSPPPDLASIVARTEGMLQDSKEQQRRQNLEILRLRQELARVQTTSSQGTTTLIEEDPTIDSDNSFSDLQLSPPSTPAAPQRTRRNGSFASRSPLLAYSSREFSIGTPSSMISPRRGVKRNRDSTTDSELEELSTPSKRAAVVIDLTDDD